MRTARPFEAQRRLLTGSTFSDFTSVLEGMWTTILCVLCQIKLSYVADVHFLYGCMIILRSDLSLCSLLIINIWSAYTLQTWFIMCFASFVSACQKKKGPISCHNTILRGNVCVHVPLCRLQSDSYREPLTRHTHTRGNIQVNNLIIPESKRMRVRLPNKRKSKRIKAVMTQREERLL